MREALVERLRCPRCGAADGMGLEVGRRDEREVREGTIACTRCGHEVAVDRGVVDAMVDPPEFVRREAAGLERFADTMRADGWDRDRVLRLPDEPSDYWRGQKLAVEGVLKAVETRPGQKLLDVGSNTCWASSLFAERGLEVTALDISPAEMQGLQTAEWWFEDRGVYFERVLGVMFDLPFADESFDLVFCSEVLHHNDDAGLRRTFAEAHRVLRPGGRLLVASEPLRFPTNRKHDHGSEVAQYEGYEHVYYFHEYALAARRAGFSLQVREPPTQVFRDEPLWLTAESSLPGSAALFVQHLLRRSRAGRRVLLAATMLLGPDAPLSMVCRKGAA